MENYNSYEGYKECYVVLWEHILETLDQIWGSQYMMSDLRLEK